jgi:glycosyltransferase involved in cell wall biosynthesis
VEESICILPKVEGLGGPASFRARLVEGLAQRGIRTHQNPNDPTCRAVLVIGGSRHALSLVLPRRRGVRIVQRLNGMNWVHRQRDTGSRHYLRSEWNNWMLSSIRRWLADRVVYQSDFARTWWQTSYGGVRAAGRVIYNGVNLTSFHPDGPGERPDNRYRVLLVEGRLGGGYEMGLENAVGLVRLLNLEAEKPVELMVVGDVPAALRARMEAQIPGRVVWRGVVHRDEIPTIDRSAHLLFSADLNAACPNSVIEAMACGLPVLAYATGSLPELVTENGGRVVPWGSNYWKMEKPDLDVLVQGARAVLDDQACFRNGARLRAEAAFGLDEMVEKYLDVLLG